METGVQFMILWSDNDILELGVTAWNGQFGGAANVYVGIGGLSEAASNLEGFPRNPSDVREITFGQFGPKSAGGAIEMRFYCNDAAGHAVVGVRIESDHIAMHPVQEAFLIISIEAAAVDRFVNDLRCLETDLRGGSAPSLSLN